MRTRRAKIVLLVLILLAWLGIMFGGILRTRAASRPCDHDQGCGKGDQVKSETYKSGAKKPAPPKPPAK